MNDGWTNCGCGTIYTDANGNPISGVATPSSSVDSSCMPDWGLLALAGVVAIVAASLAPKGSQR